jgi:hypothetical protein
VTQPDAREGQTGPPGESERPIVLSNSGNAEGGKGPWFKVNGRSGDSREIGVSLLPPTKVGKLQETLHAKAKSAPGYRFYALYDKLYRADVLWYAHRCCQFNDGRPGVDGQTFEDIKEYGQQKWLGELAEAHACHRLRQWLVEKFKVQGSRWARFSDRYLHETLGLLRLRRQPLPAISWVTA